VEAARTMPAQYGSSPSDVRNLGQRPRNHGGKSRVTAAILALLLGGLGVHKFYLGKPRAGWIMLALFVFGIITLGTFLWVAPTIALIEGILYLTKSEEEFEDQYLNSEKEWF
jgi:TM2 domain-containing membrane protein YozV